MRAELAIFPDSFFNEKFVLRPSDDEKAISLVGNAHAKAAAAALLLLFINDLVKMEGSLPDDDF